MKNDLKILFQLRMPLSFRYKTFCTILQIFFCYHQSKLTYILRCCTIFNLPMCFNLSSLLIVAKASLCAVSLVTSGAFLFSILNFFISLFNSNLFYWKFRRSLLPAVLVLDSSIVDLKLPALPASAAKVALIWMKYFLISPSSFSTCACFVFKYYSSFTVLFISTYILNFTHFTTKQEKNRQLSDASSLAMLGVECACFLFTLRPL